MSDRDNLMNSNNSTMFENNNINNNTTTSFATAFKGRNTAMSTDDLRKARETRAADALRMKDEQLKILSEQNGNLLLSLDKLEEEANTIQLEKLAVEQENRSVRDSNFELQSKARAAETAAKRMQSEVADKDKQLRIMTDQNSELLRLLESEESLTTQLQGEVTEFRAELDELRQKHSTLLFTAKTHEELATKAAKEGQLRAEEIRLLRVEGEQLKQQNTELKMKTQVEVEALQEQLRVRKEKQYQLLEKLQAQEEAKRQAEDQVIGMEEQLRGLHARNIDLETQIKVESRGKSTLEEANKELQMENNNLFHNNKDLQMKIEKSEKERIRMEAEARDSGDQLREMAEKVFQLLERLKLAEIGKTKAMEALKKKEQDMVGLQKKNARLIKESTEESKARVKAEMDIKVLQEQVRALKKNNTALAQKSKEEATVKVKALEEVDQLSEKLKAMEARLAFLLNKVQTDDENRLIQAEDRKKLEAQVLSYSEKCEELQHKLTELGESNRIITQAMRLKQEELNEIHVKYDHLLKESNDKDKQQEVDESNEDMTGARLGGPDDIDHVRMNEGRGRFYVEAKSVGGGSMLQLKSRKPLYRIWLEKQGINEFLKKAQKTTRFRDLVIEKFAAVYGLLMVEEDEKTQLLEASQLKDSQIEHHNKKIAYVQDALAAEEDAKRRMLLRYIHAVKEHALSVNGGSGGVLQLPESNITDEEIHALAALLRNNTSIDELNLRGNVITDDGARALGAVLAGKSGLRLVDLRGNKIGKGAIRVLAEALERSERVRHVYVHAGGKIEALGASRWAVPRNNTDGSTSFGNNNSNSKNYNLSSSSNGNNNNIDMINENKSNGTVETVCVVDIRDNHPEQTSFPYELEKIEIGVLPDNSTNNPHSRQTQQQQLNLKQSETPTRSESKKMKSQLSKSLIRSVSNIALNGGGAHALSSELDNKKAKIKAHEDKLLAIRESAWQGRAEGLDVHTTSIDIEAMKESIKLRKKNLISEVKRRNDHSLLPPLLSDVSNNFNDSSDNNNKPQSAPDLQHLSALHQAFPDEPEGIFMNANSSSNNKMMIHNNNTLSTITNKDIKLKGNKKQKKISETEKRLINSPLGQPLVKH